MSLLSKNFIVTNELETQKIAEDFFNQNYTKNLNPIIVLEGTLGAGKTTFARGLIKSFLAINHQNSEVTITSPTYNILKTYGESIKIAHFDFYRIGSSSEIEQLGLENYFTQMPCILEWFENIKSFLTRPINQYYKIQIDFSSESDLYRKINIEYLESL